MSKTARLILDGIEYELPIITGSEGENAIDISKLRPSTGGTITIDSGFKNTGSTTSAITFLNGEEGILRYRGYPIDAMTYWSLNVRHGNNRMINPTAHPHLTLKDIDNYAQKHTKEYSIKVAPGKISSRVLCRINGALISTNK